MSDAALDQIRSRLKVIVGFLEPSRKLLAPLLPAAARLKALRLNDDAGFARCKALMSKDASKLKGLVGEFLGRDVAPSALAGKLTWTTSLPSVLLVKITPLDQFKGSLPGPEEPIAEHKPPPLLMHGSPTLVGMIIGEVDSLLCDSTQAGLTVKGALESKGGNLAHTAVEAQKKSIADNVWSIGQEPARFCFAERIGRTYRSINNRFDLVSLAAAKVPVFSTGPIRTGDEPPFDISLGFKTDVMDNLIVYLASMPPNLWGYSPGDSLQALSGAQSPAKF